MKKILPVKNLTVILFILFICNFVNAQSRDISFTLEDRDRIIQIEEKLNSQQKEIASLRNEMNTRFESQQQQINDLKTLFYWGFGIMMSLMLFLFGFIIWDRRTAMEPLRKQTTKVSEQTQTLIFTLREYSKKQPELADILRSHGLL
ncbi:MAG: hypothetical protein HY958_01290 [Bacteroidia bacterium]|nr:hypothetical protein [Bacteroidia bacterium]